MAMLPETEADLLEDYNSGLRKSCTVLIGETVLFFGGDAQTSQISQLTPLGLMRIGTLPFGLEEGACLVMGRQLFLGFGRMNKKTCWSR